MTARIGAWLAAVSSALVGGCISVSGGNVLSGDRRVTWLDDGDPAGPAIRSESCTVAFTQIGALGGAPVIGTFEVVFDLPGGGTKSITKGSFDLPLSM